MPAAAKTLLIKIQVGEGETGKLYLVSKETAKAIRQFLQSTGDEDFISAESLFPRLGDPERTPGIALRGIRQRLGISQKVMAKKVGVSQGDLSKMERGERGIGRKLAIRMGKALKIDHRRFL